VKAQRGWLARIHTWIAVALGLYIVVLSLSGSAIVFRRDFYRWHLGSTHPHLMRLVEWLVDLHDNLLVRATGRVLNGVGGALVILLIVTGLIVWWPGWRRVPAGLRIGRPEASRRFSRQLHNVLGVASCVLLLIWALTAVYFAFPDLFERGIDYFDPDPDDLYRPGEAALLGLIKLHFGRFGGLGIRVLWVLLGLLPVVLFVTGFVLWWGRVVRPWLRRRAQT
jgi:uncharacterized iron-regulated membrane protein